MSHRSIKWTYATRALKDPPATVGALAGQIASSDAAPRANDVIVAQVMEIGHHKRVELTSALPSMLFPGDFVGVVYADRYATRQWQGAVPEHSGLCHLLSVGGVCGEVVGKTAAMGDPTTLRPLGYLVDERARRVNVTEHGLPPRRQSGYRPTTILVVGSAMDSGKTTAAFSVIHGLTRSGARVAAAKLTGTASAKDVRVMGDAGAIRVLDFTDMGFGSTANCTQDQLRHIALTIASHLAALKPDYAVMEIADGIVQRETEMLLQLLQAGPYVDYVMYACSDSVGIKDGVRRLRDYGFNVVAVSGWTACSPLAAQESQSQTDLPVLMAEQLQEPSVAGLFSPTAGTKGRRRITA